MMKAMHKALGAAAIAGLVVSLAACSSSPSSNSSGSADKPLTIWGWSGDKTFAKVLESYKDSEGYKVTFKEYTSTEYDTVLKTALSSGSGPDLMMLRAYGGLDSAVAGGGVAALKDSFAGLKNIPKNLEQGMTGSDGKIYGVPDLSVVGAVYYNKDIFAKYDLKAPKSWSDLIDIETTLKAAGVTPMAAGSQDSWVLPIYRDTFGASEYDGPAFANKLIAGDAKFTSSKYTDANQVLLDQSKYFPTASTGIGFNDSLALFTSGKAAMYPMATFALGQLETSLGSKLGVFTVPQVSGDGEPYAMGYLDGGLGMSSKLTGARRDAAERYLTWVGSAAFGKLIADKVKSIPAVSGVTPADPLLASSAKAFAKNPTPFLTFQYFSAGSPSGLSLEYDNLQKMLLGQETPAAVGVAVGAGVSQWFTPKKND